MKVRDWTPAPAKDMGVFAFQFIYISNDPFKNMKHKPIKSLEAIFMENKIFYTNRLKLPKKIASWNWKTIEHPSSAEIPEIPCVLMIATVIYNNIIVAHQVSFTANLRGFLKNFMTSVGVIAHNHKNVIYYLEEHDDGKRKEMRKILKEALDMPDII
jgi:hypothetical protein